MSQLLVFVIVVGCIVLVAREVNRATKPATAPASRHRGTPQGAEPLPHWGPPTGPRITLGPPGAPGRGSTGTVAARPPPIPDQPNAPVPVVEAPPGEPRRQAPPTGPVARPAPRARVPEPNPSRRLRPADRIAPAAPGVRIRWWQRLRAAVGLVLLAAVGGVVLAALLGLLVLAAFSVLEGSFG